MAAQELPPLTWTAPGYDVGPVSRLQELLAVPEPDGATHLELATVMQRLGLPEAARPHAVEAAEALPDSAHAQGLAGLLLSEAEDPEARRYFEAAFALDPYWGGAVLAWSLMGPDTLDNSGDEDPELRDRVYRQLAEAGTVDPELASGVWVAWQQEGRWEELLEVDELPDHLRQAARYMTGEPTGPLEPSAGLALIGAGHEEGFPLLNQLPASRLPSFYRGVRKLIDLDDTPDDAAQAAALAFGALAAGDDERAARWIVAGGETFREELVAGAGLVGGNLSSLAPELKERLMAAIVLSSVTTPHGDEVWGALPVNDDQVPLFVASKAEGNWQVTYPSGPALAQLLEAHLAQGDVDHALALANWATARPEPLTTRGELLAVIGVAWLPDDIDTGVRRLVESEQPWAPYEGIKQCIESAPCQLAITEAFPDPELQYVRAVALATEGQWRKARKVARTLTGGARDEAMAAAYSAKGDWDALEKVIARGRVDVDRWTNDLAWGLLLDGRPEDALPHAQRSVDLQRRPPLLHTLASAYVMLERYDEAAALHEEVHDLPQPADPDWAYVEARIAQAAGLDATPVWERLDAQVEDGPRSTRRLPRK